MRIKGRFTFSSRHECTFTATNQTRKRLTSCWMHISFLRFPLDFVSNQKHWQSFKKGFLCWLYGQQEQLLRAVLLSMYTKGCQCCFKIDFKMCEPNTPKYTMMASSFPVALNNHRPKVEVVRILRIFLLIIYSSQPLHIQSLFSVSHSLSLPLSRFRMTVQWAARRWTVLNPHGSQLSSPQCLSPVHQTETGSATQQPTLKKRMVWSVFICLWSLL